MLDFANSLNVLQREKGPSGGCAGGDAAGVAESWVNGAAANITAARGGPAGLAETGAAPTGLAEAAGDPTKLDESPIKGATPAGVAGAAGDPSELDASPIKVGVAELVTPWSKPANIAGRGVLTRRCSAGGVLGFEVGVGADSDSSVESAPQEGLGLILLVVEVGSEVGVGSESGFSGRARRAYRLLFNNLFDIRSVLTILFT